MPAINSFDDAVLALRPAIDADLGSAPATSADDVLHRALRPILKLHNQRLLELVADYARDYRLPLSTAAPADCERLLDELLRRNARLQHTLTGMVTSLFTASEYAFYRQHRPEINRRLLDLARQRVLSQTAAVVGLVTATE
ncbi:hypothetical protein [Solirubrum puertoriconensis]|uniref:Uncharacterized protein n=1 Tax=Solirubrum puertoriconensis TaxID=1751427 RepID=A0A9X0HLU7_SOLP1|nr:hypothetical protein [Solirubrum puertoriconensis]KUG08189.1 hypothetical protein ASU33_08335 [Solirubrum puertoriconensis]